MAWSEKIGEKEEERMEKENKEEKKNEKSERVRRSYEGGCLFHNTKNN